MHTLTRAHRHDTRTLAHRISHTASNRIFGVWGVCCTRSSLCSPRSIAMTSTTFFSVSASRRSYDRGIVVHKSTPSCSFFSVASVFFSFPHTVSHVSVCVHLSSLQLSLTLSRCLSLRMSVCLSRLCRHSDCSLTRNIRTGERISKGEYGPIPPEFSPKVSETIAALLQVGKERDREIYRDMDREI